MSVIPFRRRLIPYQFFNANYIIIGINLFIFMLGLVFHWIPGALALSPVGFLDQQHYWQILTFFFTEVDIWALVFNLLGLFFFGNQVEKEMGSIEYLLFYFCTGIGSGLLSLVLYSVAGVYGVPILGSSATVFAVLLAFTAFYPDTIMYFFGIFPLRAPILVLIFVGFQVFSLVSSWGPAALTNLNGLLLAYLYMLIRYRTNPFKNFFR